MQYILIDSKCTPDKIKGLPEIQCFKSNQASAN